MDDGYLGNARLKRVGVELSLTEEQVKEYNDGTYDNYYTWVKDTFYNGKTKLVYVLYMSFY